MKKTTIKYMTFCDHAFLSQNNKLNIIGIFDQVNVAQFPGGLPRAFVVAILNTEPNKNRRFSIKGKLGDKTVFPAINMEGAVGESGVHNIIVDLAGIGFPQQGDYEFVLSEDDEEVGSMKLKVSLVQQYEKHNKLPN